MPRVVVNKKGPNLEEAGMTCPVNCFRKSLQGEFVIDPNECIDCGVCQVIVDNGDILTDAEANEKDIEFNRANAKEWDPVQ